MRRRSFPAYREHFMSDLICSKLKIACLASLIKFSPTFVKITVSQLDNLLRKRWLHDKQLFFRLGKAMGLAAFHCITQLIILYKSTFWFIIRFTIIGKTYKSIIIRCWTYFKMNSIINITDSSIIERFYTISTNYFFSVCCSKSSSPAVSE